MNNQAEESGTHGIKKFFTCNITFKDFIRKRVPITVWLPEYTVLTFFQDLLAGFTVGLTEIPQGIAFAGIAFAGIDEPPLQYGLYSAFMGGFIYAIFGSCKDVNIGPTSILALMLQSHITAMGPDMAVIITFTSGMIIFVLALLQLGFVVQFFSYPIIAGFTCAAALQIASTQIKGLLGIPGKADAFLEAWTSVFKNIDQVRLWDTLLGVCSILFLTALKEIRRFGTLQYRNDWSKFRNYLGIFLFMLSLARNALVVIIGGLIAYNFKDSENPPFKLTGNVPSGFPDFKPPPFSTNFNGTEYNFSDIVENYGLSLIFLPLVALLEAIAIAKAFSKGRTLDATQEMLAVGVCNIFASFVSSMPITGSFTRTAVNNASGVKTPLAGIFTSFMVLLAIGFLTSYFKYIPKATLASVIVCAMFYLFDFEAFVVLWKNKKLDLVPFLGTLLCCLFISLEYGILIGIGLNLLFILYASARPSLNISQEYMQSDQIVFIIKPKDTLYFPAAEYIRDLVLKQNNEDSIIVIDGKYIQSIDITVAKIFASLVEEVKMKNQKLIFLEFKPSIIKVCLGINKEAESNFKSGNLKDIVAETTMVDNDVPFSIQ